MTPSDSSAAEYAKIQTSISSYANEMMFKFIVGEESLDNFDKYIAELNNRGLETMIRITQETYDRYLAR
jgi:putative aldouronate transport system substrate-binding protein